MNQKIIFSLLITFILSSCTSTTIKEEKSKHEIGLNSLSNASTVVLAKNEKKHNAIIVSTNKGEVKLDKVREYVNIKSKDKPPTEPKIMSKKEFKQRFGDMDSIFNPKPLHYFLYFKKETKELTVSSKQMIEKIAKLIIDRAPCVVDFIGHTDTIGTEEENIKKSQKEALYVESLFKKEILKSLTGVKNITLTTKGYGEVDLGIPTPDNTFEAKNRNVEVFIK